MEDFIDNKTFLEILHSKPEHFTIQEVMDMLEAELSYPENQIDSEIIDVCLKAINEYIDENKTHFYL